MSEFLLPDIQNNLRPVKLLANITNSTVMLQLVDSGNEFTTLEANEIGFYNQLVTSDSTSPQYNEPRILEYIDSGILTDTLFKPKPPNSYLSGYPDSTHSIINNRKFVQENQEDHLEIIYSLDAVSDTSTVIRLIVYRDADGISYSLDSGQSCLKIPSTGLLYPSEVTSVAIQNYLTEVNIGKPKIWIGTLREGLLSYTPGDTSWVSESNLEKSDPTENDPDGINSTFLFRISLVNKYEVKDSDGNIYFYIPGDYAPVYILGLINNPKSTGLPLVVYVNNKVEPLVYAPLGQDIGLGNPHSFEADFGTGEGSFLSNGTLSINEEHFHYTSIDHNGFLGVTRQADGTLKQAHSAGTNIYQVNRMEKSPVLLYRYLLSTVSSYVLDSNYNKYKVVTETLDTSWKPLSGYNKEIVDILKSIPINTTASYTSIDSGVLTAVSVFSWDTQTFITELLKITATSHIDSNERSISITTDSSIGDSIVISPNRFSGLSTYGNNVFITERTKIWRYDGESWSNWLTADGVSQERNTRISPSKVFTLVGSTSYVSGFKGFGIISRGKNNTLLGIMNTDFGHLEFSLLSTPENYLVPTLNSKKARVDLYSGPCKDFQIIPELNTVLTCGLAVEPRVDYIISKSTFGSPVRYCSVYPGSVSQLPSKLAGDVVIIGYKNYKAGYTGNWDVSNLVHNKYTYQELTSNNSDQLYLNTAENISVPMLVQFITELKYEDNRSFDFIGYFETNNTDNSVAISSLLLKTYLSGSIKYNRLKILFRTTETIKFNSATLETDLEVPFFPEIEYYTYPEIIVASGYTFPDYADSGYFIGN